MEPLDTPVKLNYDHGNNFPSNFLVISYVLLFVSSVLIIEGHYVFGIIVMTLCLFAITNRYYVKIDPEKNVIHEYSEFIGFIKLGKKYPLSKYKYITAMPLIESKHVYARSSNSTIISNNYTTITLFSERLRGKRTITKFDSKNEAVEAAMRLGERLNLTYFDYDPMLIRQILLGEKTI